MTKTNELIPMGKTKTYSFGLYGLPEQYNAYDPLMNTFMLDAYNPAMEVIDSKFLSHQNTLNNHSGRLAKLESANKDLEARVTALEEKLNDLLGE